MEILQLPCLIVIGLVLSCLPVGVAASGGNSGESRQIFMERVGSSSTIAPQVVRSSGCEGDYPVGESPCDFLKEQQVPENVRYYFSSCTDWTNCEVIGDPNGYGIASIEGLSGGWQQWLGAPVVFVVDVAVSSLVPAFLLLSSWGWAVAGTALIGGGAAGATVPFVIPKDTMILKQLNPRYHWSTGKMKRLIETSGRVLHEGTGIQKVLLFYTERSSDIKAFNSRLRTLEGVLDKLNE